jgi:hypothetical protein
LIAADHDADGRAELYVSEERNEEGYWYTLQYRDGQYLKTFISDVSQSPLAELNAVTWKGEDAFISLSEQGEGHVYRAGDLQKLESFTLPSFPVEARNFTYVEDLDAGVSLLFVAYGLWEGPLIVYSYPAMDVVWETDESQSHVTDVEVANLDADSSLEVVILGVSELQVFDWDSQAVQWSFEYSERSEQVRIGNLDNDPWLEIAGIASWKFAFVANVVDEVVRYIPDLLDLESLSLADTNEDGIQELVIGEGQWGDTIVFDAQDFSELERVPNPEHGVGGSAVADFDGDGDL